MASTVQVWLERQWQTTSYAQWLLLPLSWLFILVATLRRVLYQQRLLTSYAMPVPVIVVGNISVGGSGKTPLTIALVAQLKQAGYHPAVISRGYGGQQTGEVFTYSSAALMGDEPVLIAQRTKCPVWVNPNRVQAGLDVLKAYPTCNVIVSDDGLQHYRLKRQVEIAVLQHPYGLGNQRFLPAGPLREPLSRLTRIDVLVETGDDVNQPYLAQLTCSRFKMRLLSKALVCLGQPTHSKPATDLAGQNVIAVTGIAHPQRFFATLKQLGMQVQAYAFNDHHHFTAQDFTAWQTPFSEQATILPIVMTEKDAVKCRDLGLKNAWVLPIEAVIEHQQDKRLIDLVQTLLTTKTVA